MAYSCSDFTDSILAALGITVPEEYRDDPAMQAMIALGRITNMQEIITECRAYIRFQLDDARHLKRPLPHTLTELMERMDACLSWTDDD